MDRCSLPPLGRATPSVFWTPPGDSSPLLNYPLQWALEGVRTSTPCCRVSIFSGSFAGGGAAVFPAFGQSSFCGTNPMEFDEYSKAFYPLSLFPGTPLLAPPAFGVRQSCKPGRKMLCPA
ncbi:hypothetical protein HID58_055398 [Brassica napus]|uniref:Uncharacterized protein n=1 Tax=Brassica napus TaxID=3708 RepID=A0ABQ8AKA0_BRANA|nr:hypothetical protein HID58_055398 [Brassica napus]